MGKVGRVIGTTLGSFQVVAKLGEGGMGEVYRARDTRLNRDVALKVLPPAFANDPERLARFSREAQLLASLNHTNIASIYGMEGAALVMELVEGRDLSDLIARGPMAVADVLPIAKQIVDALDAAHENGIVHRDMKPGNIKVRADGTVKVLDFGLAKALGLEAAGDGDPMNSPTLAVSATRMGMILGTAAYMAPEQARGKAVDRRADIWAFGVILFEMITGRRAFEGDDVSITLANVLKEEPNWQLLPASLPANFHRLLRRCLEKDPRRRLSSIGDARLELEEQERPVAAASSPPAASPRPFAGWAAAALIGAMVAATITYVILARRTAALSPVSSRLSILAPANEYLYQDSATVAISPDGTMVAFVVGKALGSARGSDTRIWVRALDSMTSRRLDDTQGGQLPFWSADSRRIGFFSYGKLKIIAAAGGRAETLGDAPGPRGGTWNAANVIVFAPDAEGPLYKVSATGGKAEPITTIDAARKEVGHRFPSFLPDGKRFLYSSLPGKDGKFEIFAGSLDDTSRTDIGAFEATPVFAEPGWLMYAKQGVLAARPFDPRTLKVTGDPVMLDDEPSTILDPIVSFTAAHSVSTSATGSIAYYSAPSIETTATWYDTGGAASGTLKVPAGHYETISVSPDGTRAVMSKSTSPSESSLWIVDLIRGGTSPLSSGPGLNNAAVWSPDGERVVWANDRDGPQNLFVKTVNDAAPERLLYASDPLFKNPVDWSRDGKWILLGQLDRETSQNIYLLEASGTKPPTLLISSRGADLGGSLSPDGRWIAWVNDDTGRLELYVQAFPTAGRRIQISDQGAIANWWSRDGRQLTFLDDDGHTVWRADIRSGETFGASAPKKLVTLPENAIFVDAAPDRQRFIVLAPELSGNGSLTVVQNWRAPTQR
jgi:eukaryotic-like serine/threonine-protein kinase